MDIARFIKEKGLERRIADALAACGRGQELVDTIAHLPVKKSHAVKRFGSYIARGGEPVAIRLQFALEEAELVETFLHELAHCLDHLANQGGRPYRRAHGEGWRRWARALGISPERCGRSDALRQLHERRLKLVAVCRKCGCEVRRLRRLAGGRTYVHVGCGGRLQLY